MGSRSGERVIRVVVMSKPPVPGFVKTRLAKETSEFYAAQVHQVMLQTCVTRVSHLAADLMRNEGIVVEMVLAITGAGELRWEDMVTQTIVNTRLLAIPLSHNPRDQHIPTTTMGSKWQVVDQGEGNLGDRLRHVWEMDRERGVVFLGTDSPDMPRESLREAILGLMKGESAIGGVDDGGYYMLASAEFCPELVTDIDWGTSSVYHQTLENAENSAIELKKLPPWHDVDTLSDLEDMRERLMDAREMPLIQLQSRLHELSGD
ncbi:glycosyltransferase [Planctomycetota bacterium]|nr:glycosyltransferase [Planctomycetota bacterium]